MGDVEETDVCTCMWVCKCTIPAHVCVCVHMLLKCAWGPGCDISLQMYRCACSDHTACVYLLHAHLCAEVCSIHGPYVSVCTWSCDMGSMWLIHVWCVHVFDPCMSDPCMCVLDSYTSACTALSDACTCMCAHVNVFPAYVCILVPGPCTCMCTCQSYLCAWSMHMSADVLA